MTAPKPRPPDVLSFEPIGEIRTKMRTKFDSPHQPSNSDHERNIVRLKPGKGFETALTDLIRFDRIWLVWWFHKNQTWRPLVLPPRGEPIRRGVFATRSPHRPNAIGITAVPLLGVDKLDIYVGNTDLIDRTPILDIKPYIPTVDAFPDASLGWTSDVEAQLSEPSRHLITYAPLATSQLEWLKTSWEIDFMPRAADVLRRHPTIHRTRRIRRWRDDLLQMGCGAWRVIFSVRETVVTIHQIVAGYPDSLLLPGPDEDVPDQEAQIAFKARWPREE